MLTEADEAEDHDKDGDDGVALAHDKDPVRIESLADECCDTDPNVAYRGSAAKSKANSAGKKRRT